MCATPAASGWDALPPQITSHFQPSVGLSVVAVWLELLHASGFTDHNAFIHAHILGRSSALHVG